MIFISGVNIIRMWQYLAFTPLPPPQKKKNNTQTQTKPINEKN